MIGRSYCSISAIYQAVVENLIFKLVLLNILPSVKLLDPFRSNEFTSVANTAKRPVLKELHLNIPPLQPTQVQNVLHDKRHCENDPIDTQALSV